MHDPMTVAFDIRSPFGKKNELMKDKSYRYHAPIITIWHVDPESDGTDDSCDWFGRKLPRGVRDEVNSLPEDARRAVHMTLWVIGDRRPWYRKPKWHVRHWRLQVHPIQQFKRWTFSRCAGCGHRFRWGYAPVSNGWGSSGPRWFQGEAGIYHGECFNMPKGVAVEEDA